MATFTTLATRVLLPTLLGSGSQGWDQRYTPGLSAEAYVAPTSQKTLPAVSLGIADISTLTCESAPATFFDTPLAVMPGMATPSAIESRRIGRFANAGTESPPDWEFASQALPSLAMTEGEIVMEDRMQIDRQRLHKLLACDPAVVASAGIGASLLWRLRRGIRGSASE